jgi:hypothetical protein
MPKRPQSLACKNIGKVAFTIGIQFGRLNSLERNSGMRTFWTLDLLMLPSSKSAVFDAELRQRIIHLRRIRLIEHCVHQTMKDIDKLCLIEGGMCDELC